MASTSITHVILGDGIAGMSAAQLIRTKRPEDQIIVISKDPHPFYYRAALTNYLSGALSDEELWAMPAHHWEQLRIQRVFAQVNAVDVEKKHIVLHDNQAVRYDRLLIATGCRARTMGTPEQDPKRGVAGADLPGVCVMRTLADTRRILERLGETTHALVLGAGILGIEACHGLHARNIQVDLVHRGPWLLERMLDRRAGELIAARMSRDGIGIHLDSGIKQIRGSARGVSSVILASGKKVNCSAVICCIGNLPNTEWLQNSGIELSRGYIPVDRKMSVASCRDVWAAGDVTNFVDKELPFPNPAGLWQPARKQGQIAALGMVEQASFAAPDYRPGVLYNATKAWDLDLGTLGHHVDAGDADDGESLVFESRQANQPIYKRILLRDNHVVGALLLGDRREGHALRHLMNLRGDQGDVSTIKDQLFDTSFDLPSWVAARTNQPNAERWKKTVLLPAGPLPPSVAVAAGNTTQLEIANPVPLNTLLAKKVTDEPISFRSQGQVHAFRQRLVRVGMLDRCDLKVGDPNVGSELLSFSREGTLWVATTDRRRGTVVKINKKSLDRPTVVNDGDLITFGTWMGVVELSTRKKQQTVAEPRLQAALVHGGQRFPLKGKVVTMGSSADNAIVLGDGTVSPFHAQIHTGGQPPEFYVMDAGSQHGTFVNNTRVHAPVRLQAQGTLRIGSLELRLEIAERAAEDPSPDQQRAPTPSEPRQSLFLSVESGRMKGKVFQLPVPGTIGRGTNTDLHIDDSLLSRNHARVELLNGGFQITDLNSSNGTVVGATRLAAGASHPITGGDTLRLGQQVFRVGLQEVAAPAQEFQIPQDHPRIDFKIGEKTQPFSLSSSTIGIGRDDGNDIQLADASVSRRHARLEMRPDGYHLRDMESGGGTFLNGNRLSSQNAELVVDEDVIQIGVCKGIYRTPLGGMKFRGESTVVADDQEHQASGGFRIDWSAVGDPLTTDLRKTVQDELDSCIGCHECMRACPLPDSSVVSIGALNSFAGGSGDPMQTALQFVDDCTQCQACVPVCPVDIHRSRIVLWNKLKRTPDPTQRVNLQVGKGYETTDWTLDDLSRRFESHPILSKLNGPERVQLMANARCRKLIAQEFLLYEGRYPDAVWFIVEGRLEIGMGTGRRDFQRMVILNDGQSVGETALLSDQPSDLTARAMETTIVIGVPKYALKASMNQNPKFRQALEALYISRSIEVFLKKLPSLSDLSDEVLCDLIAELDAERYLPGTEILSAQEATSTFAIVKRGFVKELRSVDGRQLIANYYRYGEAFGTVSRSRRGTLQKFEAGTVAEVFTIGTKAIAKLESKYPGLAARLMLNAPQGQEPAEGRTGVFQEAAAEGLLQASRLLVIDTRSCVDCDNCVSACERRHGAARLDRAGAGRQVGPYQVPASCFHCEDPVCLLCAVDGIVREPTGEIRIIPDNCIGCGACADRCPYDNIQMVARDAANKSSFTKLLPNSIAWLLGLRKPVESLDDFEKLAVKCDLCSNHSDGPACVRSCPTGAAQRVDPLAIFSGNGTRNNG